MKAFVHENGENNIKKMEDPVAGKGEVVVSLISAGLNRRDAGIADGQDNEKDALILGSDGAGTVTEVGANVTEVHTGDEVMINPSLRWTENADAAPPDFDILGMPDNGTFAEKIVISSEQVETKPDHLSWQEAGVTALAGLTGYRAMFTKGKLQKGETVFIPGAGSGVATFMIQFAKAVGAKVITTSRSEIKREKAAQLGADMVLSTNADWEEALRGITADLVIDSVGRATFNRSLGQLKRGGWMVVFGATTEDTVEVDLRDFFYGQYQLLGSTMGSRDELQAMLQFIQDHHIHPVIDTVFPLEDANEAFNHLKENNTFGKIGLTIRT